MTIKKMIQKSKYTFLYHLFILKYYIWHLVSHKKFKTSQYLHFIYSFFSFPLNLFIVSAGITIHSSRQYFIIFDLLIFNPIYFLHLPSLSFTLSSSTPILIISHPPISNFLSHSLPFHLNYITPTSKNHQQIVNIIPYPTHHPHHLCNSLLRKLQSSPNHALLNLTCFCEPIIFRINQSENVNTIHKIFCKM